MEEEMKYEKQIIEKGEESEENIKQRTIVEVMYRGWIEGQEPFDYQELEEDPFVFRIGSDTTILPALQAGIMSMQKGEKSIITIPKAFGFTSANRDKLPQRVEHQDLVYEVKVLKFYEKDTLDMFIDRVEVGQQCKASANQLYQQGHYQQALDTYEQGITNLEFDDTNTSKTLKLDLMNNRSLMYYKQKQYKLAVEEAERALRVEASHPKALLRKAQALIPLGDFTQANAILQSLQSHSLPQLSLITQQLHAAQKAYKQKSKAMFNNIFN